MAILLVSAICFAGYQYGDFEREKPINEWCDNIKIISPAPGIATMAIVKFSLFDKKLDPQIAYIINGKGSPVFRSFNNTKFPPTYQFSTPLKNNSINYVNTMVVNVPEEISYQLKTANTIKVVFFSNGKPITCNVPDSLLKEWKSKLR